jgi:hypothetical protein
MSTQKFVDISGYEGLYQVNRKGEVLSVRYGRLRKPTCNQLGYFQVKLENRPRKPKAFLVHRLVMAAFAPIDGWESMEVNHKDGDKSNNRIENLEWVTSKENTLHAIEVLGVKFGGESKPMSGKKGMSKTIGKTTLYHPELDMTMDFESVDDAAQFFKVKRNAILTANNRASRVKGFYCKIKFKKYGTPITATPIAGGEPVEFESIAAASSEGFNAQCISHVINGRHKSHKGYVWSRVEAISPV